MFEFKNTAIDSNHLTIYNARMLPFKLYGLYKSEQQGLFRRMPIEIAGIVSEKVKELCTNTSGVRLRFKTDSDYIAVGAIYPPIKYITPVCATASGIGSFCFDLYADQKFCKVLLPDYISQDGNIPRFQIENGQFEAAYDFGSRKLRNITLNFPYFVNISDIYIGLREECVVEESEPYANTRPIVFYGSSITQGACASRPGNIYQNILSRRWNLDYLNLGFASGAKAEETMIDYLCTLDMSMLVFDYDHNAESPQYLEDTHYKALEKIRKARPDIPIVLLSRPNLCGGEEEVKQRIAVIERSYHNFLDQGDKNIYFINGQEILCSHDSEMVTIDGTHPTDFGFYCIAEALSKVMSEKNME